MTLEHLVFATLGESSQNYFFTLWQVALLFSSLYVICGENYL